MYKSSHKYAKQAQIPQKYLNLYAYTNEHNANGVNDTLSL